MESSPFLQVLSLKQGFFFPNEALWAPWRTRGAHPCGIPPLGSCSLSHSPSPPAPSASQPLPLPEDEEGGDFEPPGLRGRR